jgi:putative tryptophan/tyrosine transport system substrate-binding protein
LVIKVIAGSAIAWPPPARSQQRDRIRVIGMLMGQGNDSRSQARVAEFAMALHELGWIEGRNVRFEVRWGAGDINLTRSVADELVKLAPDVILAVGTTAIATLKQSTRSIPLVFVVVNEPVAQGFVSSVAHPGGNITGFSYMDYSVIQKALQLLKQVAPTMNRVGFMFNPDTYPYYERYLESFVGQQEQVGFEITPLRVRSEADIAEAFKDFAAASRAGFFAPPEPFMTVHRKLVVELAARYRLPAAYGLRDFVTDGGMMSYAQDISDIFRRSASYIDSILKGADPGELPVQAPTRTEFVINLRTARELGIAIPPNLLALADEVIE